MSVYAQKMAIYHCSVKAISRSAGRSATAAAAYRSGSKIEDQRTAEIHDYTRKGGVLVTGIEAPENAPAWAKDRAELWNQVEASEKRKNSKVAREVEVALPSELNAGQMRELTESYGKWLSARYGVAVDWAVHQAHRHGDDRNHHAHIMMTTRTMGPDGLGAKTRVLDDQRTGPEEVKAMREQWAELVNRSLEIAGKDARVDHRSLRAQEIDRVPQIHAGPAAIGIERKEATRKAGPALRGAVDAALVGQATDNGRKLAEIWTTNRDAAAKLWEEQHPARWYHQLPIIKGKRDKSRNKFVQAKLAEIAPVGHTEAQAQTIAQQKVEVQKAFLFTDMEGLAFLAYRHSDDRYRPASLDVAKVMMTDYGAPDTNTIGAKIEKREADIIKRRAALGVSDDDPRILAAYMRGQKIGRNDRAEALEAQERAQEAARTTQRATEDRKQVNVRNDELEAEKQAQAKAQREADRENAQKQAQEAARATQRAAEAQKQANVRDEALEAQKQAQAKADKYHAAIARLVDRIDEVPTNEKYGPVGEFRAIHPAKNGRALLILRDRVGQNIPFSVDARLLKVEPPAAGTVVCVLNSDRYHPDGEYSTHTVLLSHRPDDLRAAIKEQDAREARKRAKREAEKQQKRGVKKDRGPER